MASFPHTTRQYLDLVPVLGAFDFLDNAQDVVEPLVRDPKKLLERSQNAGCDDGSGDERFQRRSAVLQPAVASPRAAVGLKGA